MTLTPGSRFGGHDVISRIGAGGMGEVYLAHDTTLDRSVALKLLPAEFADDAERLIRFDREARTLASLNHPNIAQIFGVETIGGVRAIVMEFVEGEDLSARLSNGAMPLEEALSVARQITDALDAAHGAGIVHRDLKPANVKVRPDGGVKVLDFGLAKFETGVPGAAVMNSPTMTSPAMTRVGTILGTAAYMAPEQAKGRLVDKRADIWAFGCVLFEMLSGHRLFGADDVSETLAMVLKSEPPWTRLPAETPEAIRRLLRRCLVRDPRNRLPDIGVARLDIDEALSGPGMPAPSARGRATWLIAMAAGVAGIAFGVVAALGWRESAAPGVPLRTVQIISHKSIRSQQLSPDGTAVAFVRDDQLVVRSIETAEENELAGTDGAANPFWSPDSDSLAFFRLTQLGWELRTVPARGGTSSVLVAARQASETAPGPVALLGGTWCAAGVVFHDNNARTLRMVRATNGEILTTFPNPTDRGTLAYPHCLADGRVLAVRRMDDKAALVVVSPTDEKTLLELPITNLTDVRYPVLAGSSQIIFERADPTQGLWVLPVSADLSAPAGSARLLMADASRPSAAAGMLTALTGSRFIDRHLIWVDRGGKELSRFGGPQREFRTVSVSPDSRQAVSGGRRGVVRTLWLHGPDTVSQWHGEAGSWPAWSPDGLSIAYEAAGDIIVRTAAGTHPRVIAQGAGQRRIAPMWMPQSDGLVYSQTEPASLWLVPLTPGATPQLILENAREGSVSPNGKLIAYTSDRTGRSEVYVTTFPDRGRVTTVSIDGGRYPLWTKEKDELIFACGRPIGDEPGGARAICAARIDMRTGDRLQPPTRLFDAAERGLRVVSYGARGFDIAADGSRILLQTEGTDGIPTITLLENVDAFVSRRAQ